MQIALHTADGRRAARGRTARNGSFRIGVPVKRPATYEARFGGAVSNTIAVRVRPALRTGFLGSGVGGRPLRHALRVRPVAVGPVRVEIRRRGRLVTKGEDNSSPRIRLGSDQPAEYPILLLTPPSTAYAPSRHRLRKNG